MSQRTRILFYSHTRKVSGAERILLSMLAVLNGSSFATAVACPVEGPGELDRLLLEQGVTVVPAPSLSARFTSNPFKLMKYLSSAGSAILLLRRLVRGQAPALLHANSVRAGIVATLATVGTGTPVLWHVQDDLPPHPLSTLVRLVAYLSRRTRCVAVSPGTARAFSGGLDFGKRLEVLWNGIDLRPFPRKRTPLDEDAACFRNDIGLTEKDFLVASISMLNRRKGLLELIEAFAEMMPQAPEAHLAIVGAPIFNDDHLYEARLRKRSRELALDGRVHFTGPRSDAPAILRGADLLVLNASTEPFGLVVVEAISSGTAVVVTSVCGVAESLEDGVTAQIVPPPQSPREGDRAVLSGRLLGALRDPDSLKLMAENAYTKVLPRFSLEEFSRNLHALYAGFIETGFVTASDGVRR